MATAPVNAALSIPTQAGAPKSNAAAMLAVLVMGIIGVLIIPLPPLLLDFLLATSVAASLVILLLALRIRDALEISIFPSLLLLVTLLRLALNIATTRLILSHGGDGAGAAGHIVDAFGRFAVGGSALIGAVVFVILMIINFVVITKGSGRISEVAARFTLDALPGKQMSIDADLAAGLIDEEKARARRKRLEQETEFFGAMDGAAKFVRGDAVAGIAITGVNIVGGLIAGLVRDGSSLSKAIETYTILTIGDGLVSQIPALLISTAAGLVVTRAGTTGDLGDAFKGQLLQHPAALSGAAVVLGGIGLVPGMPLPVFALLAGGLFMASRRAKKPGVVAAAKAAAGGDEAGGARAKKEEKPQDALVIDALAVELSASLLSLIDGPHAELPQRVTSLRKQIAGELGILLPPIHLRDDLKLNPGEYRVLLRGNEIARGTVHAGRVMVLDPNAGEPQIEGISAREPAFGLPARWIRPDQRAAAEARGFTTVDLPSAITTHLGEVVRRHAHDLLGRQEMQELLALVAKESPKLVEDTVPAAITLGELAGVCRGLLREGVPIRDLRSVLEAVADVAGKSKDPAFLIEQVRKRLARTITARVSDGARVVRAMTLDRAAEMTLRSALAVADGEPVLALDVETARRLVDRLQREAETLTARGHSAVLLAPADLRRPLYDLTQRFISDLTVISARELAAGTTIEPVSIVALTA